MNAWREAATFIHEGVLKIPDEATLIWADNGHGILDDRGAIAKDQGEYYHTAMYDYMSNHYSEMMPLERIQRELGRAAKAGATRWLLVNTANVRPVVMTTRAVMELAWNPTAVDRSELGRKRQVSRPLVARGIRPRRGGRRRRVLQSLLRGSRSLWSGRRRHRGR